MQLDPRSWSFFTPARRALSMTADSIGTSLHNAYSRNFVRPVERYENIDTDILNRNPALFATLCGLDDAFGKSGESGADFNRLGYAARAGYGRTALPREVARFG